MNKNDRLAWIEAYESTGSVTAVCATFGISQPTFRKWMGRYRAQGLAGLEEPSRRPSSSPNRKVFEREEKLILDFRREQKYGIHRIKSELLAHGIDVSTHTILKVLRRAGEPPLRPSRQAVQRGRAMERTTGLDNGAGVSPILRGIPNDEVANAIATLITDGQFLPGEKLSESTLSSMLGVGRAPVRAALQSLAPSGLIVLQRNRGAFVNNPSMPEVEQAYAARRLIEGEIVADICRHCTSHDIRLLRRHVEQQTEAQKTGDRGSLVRLLTEFHTVLASLGENRALEEFVKILAVKTSLAVLLYDHVGSTCAIEEHGQLIDLMAAGDVEAAKALMDKHLTNNQSRLPRAAPSGIWPSGESGAALPRRGETV